MRAMDSAWEGRNVAVGDTLAKAAGQDPVKK